MSADHLFSAVRYVQQIEETVRAQGVRLEVGTDFKDFCNIPKIQPEKAPVAPIFDPEQTSISPSDAFWIKGYNDHGEIVHTQATRLLNLADVSLNEHLAHYLRDYRPHGNTVDPRKSKFSLSPITSQITGKVCYHGELWIKTGERGYRGSCLSALLPRLAFILSYLEWSPDYILGIMTPLTVCRGLAAKAGYTYLDQGTIHWHQIDQNQPMEEWLGWMNNADLKRLPQVSPEKFNAWYQNTEAKEELRKAS